jgi:hypothetical protein
MAKDDLFGDLPPLGSELNTAIALNGNHAVLFQTLQGCGHCGARHCEPMSKRGRDHGLALGFSLGDGLNGKDSYTSDPYLNEAGVVLLQKKLPLAGLLMDDPRFRVVYEDQIAIVFVRR